MEENYKKLLSWVVVSSVVVFLILKSIINNISFSDNLSYTMYIVVALSLCYVKWGWRINPFEKTPKLYCEYQGIVVSDYDRIERNIRIKICQELFRVSIVIDTDESHSRAIMSKIYNDNGDKILSYSFINVPDANVRDRSDIHYGMCTLCINDINYLCGQYFTDRKTRGDIKLNAVNTKKTSNQDTSALPKKFDS